MLNPGTKLGPYEILAPAGAGGMGEVYRARDTRLDRTVAVKILPDHLASSPDLKQRFEREARAISSLNHPNICQLYDVGSQDGIEYLVMEYVEGDTLASRLQRGALPVDQVLKLGAEIAEALEKAHRSGFVHRDLKPGNIMLTKSGAKLLDFGLAKSSAAVAGTAVTPLTPSTPTMTLGALALSAPEPLTRQGTVLGTFQYMAPEVLQGAEADARSDIFSLGCVLYEMTTGRPAFTGRSQLSVLTAILESDPAPITASQPLAPPTFDYTVRTCLAKNPDERWQSAADVGRNLQLVKSVAAAPRPAVTRYRKFAYVLAAVCVLLAGFALWLATTRENGRAVAAPQLARFAFVAPVNSAVTDLAVSPDGRQIAFANAGSLWLRPVDSDVARKLPGTAGAHQPFWSPDQKYVGFNVGMKLKKIALADGSVQDICDLPGYPAGMTWNQDEVILIGNYHRGVLRVSANGGEPVALPLNTARHENSQRGPWFLPDGHRFLFTSGSGDFVPTATNREIDVGDLSGAPPRRVLLANSNVEYVDGKLLYVDKGALVAQEFDPSTATVKGEPAVFDTNVRFRAAFAYGIFGAGPGVLAYTRTQPNSLKWMAREGGEIGDLGVHGEVASFDVAPDGKSAVIEITDQKTGNGELWLLDLQRNVSTRLTLDDTSWNWGPIWSADGKAVYFSSTRSDFSDLYRRDIGASDDRLLLRGADRLAPLDVSRDGRYLLYEALDSTTAQDIWVLPLAGGKPFPYLKTKYAETSARFSPDGRWVTYVSNESGAFEVYVQSFPTAGQKFRISTEGGMDPRWRADGRELYFIAPDNRLMASEVSTKGGFKASVPKPSLLRVPSISSGDTVRRNYWPAADGRSFLALQEPTDSPAQVNVVVNWAEALKK